MNGPKYLQVQTLDEIESNRLEIVFARSELELKRAHPEVFGVRKLSASGMWSGCITREPKEVKK